MIEQRITPSLMFNERAQEAVDYYVSAFPEARLVNSQPGPDGNLLVAFVEVAGTQIMIISGGPPCEFSEASTLMISCRNQSEVDAYYGAITDGGEALPCGWAKDRFGVFWQVTPRRMGELMSSGTPAQCEAVMNAMFEMTKFDIAALEEAFESAR
ncbi:MAG: VOC family protein [Fimbriimonadaceae bacterium]|nr:VOC family protein [Fimbriimonadaceae bacterium]